MSTLNRLPRVFQTLYPSINLSRIHQTPSMTTRVFRGITYSVTAATADHQAMSGTSGPDWIEVRGGNNTVSAGNGNNVVLAGVSFVGIADLSPFDGEEIGFDLIPNAGRNVIHLGHGNDYVAAGSGDDTVYLGEGNNVFESLYYITEGEISPGDDLIYAGRGNDVMTLGVGNSTVYAGDGDNFIANFIVDSPIPASPSPLIENDIRTNDVDTIDGTIAVYTGSGNDDIRLLNSKKITVSAGDGDNTIFAVGKTVSVTAGQGDDLIAAAGLDVTVAAGNGDNILLLTPIQSTTATAGNGDDYIVVEADDLASKVTIRAGEGVNTILTLNATCQIYAGSKNDLIYSGEGNDTIWAGGGNNVINLRGGIIPLPPFPIEDPDEEPIELIGGGDDTVYAGAGRDLIRLGAMGFATIYQYGRGDRLDVTGLGNVTVSQVGRDTVVRSGGDTLAILKGTQANSVVFA